MRAAVLAFLLIATLSTGYYAHAQRIPKLCRGLRCVNPFCDFECLRSDVGTTSGDLGLDVDVDDAMVPTRKIMLVFMLVDSSSNFDPAQATRWLQIHGFTMLGQTCATDGCDGKYETDGNWRSQGLRCVLCWSRRSARGEFFSFYKSVISAILLIYFILNRWRPSIVMHELDFRGYQKYFDMVGHIGTICKFILETMFKHSLGRWTYCVMDESATGLLSLSLWFVSL